MEALLGNGLPPGDAFGNQVGETGGFCVLVNLSLRLNTFPVFFD